MAVTIGPKLQIDGEKQYRDGINAIIQQAKTLDSEMKLVTSAFTKNTSVQEQAAKKYDVLTKQIKNQEDRVSALNDMLKKSAEKYGENSINTLKWQEAVNNASAALNDMQGELADVVADLGDAAGSGDDFASSMGGISGDLGDAASGMDDVSGAADDASSSIVDLADAFGVKLPGPLKNIGGLLGGVSGDMLAFAGIAGAALGGVGALATDTLKWADDMATLSTQTGISVKTLERFDALQELTDTSLETITGSITKLKKAMGEAQDGNDNYVAAFERLGIKITDNDGKLRDSETVFFELIGALSEMEAGTDRDVILMDLLGRKAEELNPLIEYMSENWDIATGSMDEFYTVSDRTLENINKLKNSIDETAAKIRGSLKQAIGEIADLVAGDWNFKGVSVGSKAYDAGIGRNAGGTYNWGGGWTWVGENGPELMRLPSGTQIRNHTDSINNRNTFNIYGAAGQNVEQLADIIMDKMDNAVNRREAIYK